MSVVLLTQVPASTALAEVPSIAWAAVPTTAGMTGGAMTPGLTGEIPAQPTGSTGPGDPGLSDAPADEAEVAIDGSSSAASAPSSSVDVTEPPAATVPDETLSNEPAGAIQAVQAETGVPAGTVLTPMTGNLTISTPGYVLDGVDLRGCLRIAAPDVVVRNSRITCGSPQGLAAVQTVSGASRFLIEDSEVDGAGSAPIGIGFSNVTARRMEIRNSGDGFRASWSVVVEDSWIHDMVRLGDQHPDAIQTTGGTGIVIRGNYLDPFNAATRDLMNSAVMMGSETSTTGLNNVVVEHNYLDSGNYTASIRGDTVFSNVVFRDNVFGSRARYGPFQAPAGIIVESSNVLSSNGATFRINLAQ